VDIHAPKDRSSPNIGSYEGDSETESSVEESVQDKLDKLD